MFIHSGQLSPLIAAARSPQRSPVARPSPDLNAPGTFTHTEPACTPPSCMSPKLVTTLRRQAAIAYPQLLCLVLFKLYNLFISDYDTYKSSLHAASLVSSVKSIEPKATDKLKSVFCLSASTSCSRSRTRLLLCVSSAGLCGGICKQSCVLPINSRWTVSCKYYYYLLLCICVFTSITSVSNHV